MSAATATRSQLALQSYLDALLQEATFEDLEPPVETPPAPAPAPLKPVALAVAEVATPAPALETLPVDHGFDEFEAAVLAPASRRCSTCRCSTTVVRPGRRSPSSACCSTSPG